MVTLFFDDYEVKPLVKHPQTGDIIQTFELAGLDVKLHFPMQEEQAKLYYEMMGETLGLRGGFKPASMEDLKKEVKGK